MILPSINAIAVATIAGSALLSGVLGQEQVCDGQYWADYASGSCNCDCEPGPFLCEYAPPQVTLYDNIETCCAIGLSWIDPRFCNSRSTGTYTNGWIVDWTTETCVKDCDPTLGPPCANPSVLADLSAKIHDTVAECCGRLNWIPRKTCIAESDITPPPTPPPTPIPLPPTPHPTPPLHPITTPCQELYNASQCTKPADLSHPPFNDTILDQPAEYDILKKLVGTWVNTDDTSSGIHTTMLPSPGTNSEQIGGKMHFVTENYTETLTFELVERWRVRNRGGTNEQMIGAVQYNQSIFGIETRKGLHEEIGMYMWLNDMYNHPATKESIEEDLGAPELLPGDGARGPNFVPFHTIARSGTIPHGNSILLLGKQQGNSTEIKSGIEGPPKFPTGLDTWDFAHLAMQPSMGAHGLNINLDKPPPSWVHDPSVPIKDPSGNKAYVQRILADKHYPHSSRPDLRLRDTIKDQKITKHDFILLDTEFDNGQGPQGGILSTPMVAKYTPVSKMTFRMWIEEVEEEGEIILQLQYEQIMFFQFGFGTTGGKTFWPHIQVNTLRKKKDD